MFRYKMKIIIIWMTQIGEREYNHVSSNQSHHVQPIKELFYWFFIKSNNPLQIQA